MRFALFFNTYHDDGRVETEDYFDVTSVDAYVCPFYGDVHRVDALETEVFIGDVGPISICGLCREEKAVTEFVQAIECPYCEELVRADSFRDHIQESCWQ